MSMDAKRSSVAPLLRKLLRLRFLRQASIENASWRACCCGAYEEVEEEYAPAKDPIDLGEVATSEEGSPDPASKAPYNFEEYFPQDCVDQPPNPFSKLFADRRTIRFIPFKTSTVSLYEGDRFIKRLLEEF